ncbi:DMT family transporter [Saliniramus sp.]|uniref:DMT family transporter n=1 Tax=Saliniramus sp. TaxID=2986772 RepID=UPI002CE1B25F|nr:DMT family transporter [Saliniramus sp.]HMB09788.1 DMT family transporter [Saliniramus sp.]
MSGSESETARAPAELPAHLRPFDATALTLYALVVGSWGFSWIALRMQLGVVAPEVSLLWRFLLAGAVMWCWVLGTRQQIVFPARLHAAFVAVGVTMFSFNFIMYYYGGMTIPSGLLAVAFSLAAVGNPLMAALFLRQPIAPRVALGGLLGVIGVAALYWPEIAGSGFSLAAAKGLVLCLLGTLSFSTGNIVSGLIGSRGVPLIPAITWSMSYGVVFLFGLSLAQGHAFIIEPNLRYLGSLVFLAIVASIIAFAAYIGLLRRIGPGRAGYATVMFPIAALSASTVLEGYSWTLIAAFGAALALAGNLVVLRNPKSAD